MSLDLGTQILHCIENSAKGGESILVDGFKAATILRERNPRAFFLLSETPVEFTWQGMAGVYLRFFSPSFSITSLLRSSLFNFPSFHSFSQCLEVHHYQDKSSWICTF